MAAASLGYPMRLRDECTACFIAASSLVHRVTSARPSAVSSPLTEANATTRPEGGVVALPDVCVQRSMSAPQREAGRDAPLDGLGGSHQVRKQHDEQARPRHAGRIPSERAGLAPGGSV